MSAGPPDPVLVRGATPADYAAVAELTVAAYQVLGEARDHYQRALRDVAGRAKDSTVLVAELSAAPGRVVGAVACIADGQGPLAEVAGSDEATLRMLAVEPSAQGHGVGEALLRACLGLARNAGRRQVALSTRPAMTNAARLYTRLGFRRVPERDWQPVPGADLLVYVLELTQQRFCDRCGREQAAATDTRHAECRTARQLEPPRFCPVCARRLRVRVLPHAWIAQCARHGQTRSGDETQPA